MTAVRTRDYAEPTRLRVERPTLLGHIMMLQADWRERSRARRTEIARSEAARLRSEAQMRN